ncbi:MAG: ASKHA domain-containing protein [Acidimicrobiia bacterium]
MTDCRVVFTPSGLTTTVPAGTTVLAAARAAGADLDSVCGGRRICGHCQVVPATGSYAKWSITATDAAIVTDDRPGDEHLARPLAAGAHLGCVARVHGDAVVDVPAASQVHRPVVRKTVDLADLVVDPVVTLAYVELGPPDGRSVVTHVRDELHDQHGVKLGAVDAGALTQLARGFPGTGRGGTLVLRRTDASALPVLAAVLPGFTDTALGVAVDVGSTTIAGHLCDLTSGEVLASAGRMNPQIRFGEDLMSRVSYVMMNPGGAGQLTAAVRDALAELVAELLAAATTAPDHVLEMVIVGNPIMHHLVLGLDPTPLGTAPFELATDEAVTTTATDLDLALPHARVWCAPCIAGHVGADTAAAMLSERPYAGTTPQLLVDIGTNAEIVLGSTNGVFAASSPTGPAFEGAQISCGQRATVGAIEHVDINPETLEPVVRVIGCDLASDEAEFAARAPAVTGVCGSGIVGAVAAMFLAGIVTADGTIDGRLAARSPRVVPDNRTFGYLLYESGTTRLVVTQNDVRAIQLAKAALRAGIDLLMEHAGVAAVDDIRLAGAFGAHLDPLDALVLGLVPDAPVAAVRSVGNAAGAGAVRALLSGTQRREIEREVRRVVKIETATEARFQELFVAAMAFPHATASTAHLAGYVTLPEADPAAGGAGRRRNRTRRHA